MEKNKTEIITEIKKFLDGSNQEHKYLVNVETTYDSNEAHCIYHNPESKNIEIKHVKYTPFLYMKDLKKRGVKLYNDDKGLQKAKMIGYGIKFKKLKIGDQPRLRDGFCYKVSSSKSYDSILKYFDDGGLKIYEKKKNSSGRNAVDSRGYPIYVNKHFFYTLKTNEQFFISTGIRLFKGFEEYKNVHRLTFDIETTGLRYNLSRMFAIGVRDNNGFEIILKVDKKDDDESEKKLIQDFFNTIDYIKPAVIQGYNSEMFDFEFILGRAEILKIDLNKLKTTFNKDIEIKRIPNSSVKIGNSGEKYTATKMWGYNVIDINHASKKTAAINTDIKNTRLKYICQFEKIAKKNRMYIDGSDGNISRYWEENKVFIINPKNNEYFEIPNKWQLQSEELFKLQELMLNKQINDENLKLEKKRIINGDTEFVKWLVDKKNIYLNYKFIKGKDILNRYLLDDLWETEQVDSLYNQSTFLLAKLLPTNFQRVATMGNASVWNLLMTTWSYENDIAIPDNDVSEHFGGGLARCYKKGFSERIIKIDFASLYPMIQLTWDVFPMFDITGVIKKLLVYMTTTRNIYKKLANNDKLNGEEVVLLKEIDNETYNKYVNNKILDSERITFKVKQLPIKIINNSLFGALGSGIAFNWSDNYSAAKITAIGRIQLRKAIEYFKRFGLEPLLAVTDGVNFSIPNKTTIKVIDGVITYNEIEGLIEDMWKYKDAVGVTALIDMFNDVELKGFMSVDNDGEFKSTYNLARINYALLQEKKDKKTNTIKEKIKLTGNTIKSKIMPEYIEEFINKGFDLILHGKGVEFVEYYYSYVEDIFYERIPLKKIASKSKIKETIKKYENRGVDKNGREKGKKAHMELLIMKRNKIALEIFKERKSSLINEKDLEKDFSVEEIKSLVSDYMPPEQPLDSVVYLINTGTKKSHGNSKLIKDEKNPQQKRFSSRIIEKEDLENNPNLLGKYNVDKYLGNFNLRARVLLEGFEPEVSERILAKIKYIKEKDENKKIVEKKILEREYFNNKELELKSFKSDDFNESLLLERKEMNFWNKYGGNPFLIWDGIGINDEIPSYREIYNFKLKKVREIMKQHNKSIPKSIDDILKRGDFVLLKNNNNYSMGYHNGVHIEIKKENLNLPKCDLEIELEEEERKTVELIKAKKKESDELKKRDKLNKKLKDNKRKEMFLKSFCKEHDIPTEQNIDELFNLIPDAKIMFEEYVLNFNEEVEYLGVD